MLNIFHTILRRKPGTSHKSHSRKSTTKKARIAAEMVLKVSRVLTWASNF